MDRPVEVGVPGGQAGRAAVDVEGHDVEPGLGEAAGEVLVEGVQAATVREEEDAAAVGDARGGAEGIEPVAVGRSDLQPALLGDRPGDDGGGGRAAVGGVAHGLSLSM